MNRVRDQGFLLGRDTAPTVSCFQTSAPTETAGTIPAIRLLDRHALPGNWHEGRGKPSCKTRQTDGAQPADAEKQGAVRENKPVFNLSATERMDHQILELRIELEENLSWPIGMELDLEIWR